MLLIHLGGFYRKYSLSGVVGCSLRDFRTLIGVLAPGDFGPLKTACSKISFGRTSGIRTRTCQILSLMPLPIGLPSLMVGEDDGT